MILSKAKIKYIESLHNKKIRQKYNNFIVEGEKMANEILLLPFRGVELVVALPTWLAENRHLLAYLDCEICETNEADLKKISTLTTPNKVLMVLKKQETVIDNTLINNDLCIYLDALQDPGNVGTIFRIADWFGIPYMFCGAGTVDAFSPKVIQASMGAFLRVRAIEIDLLTLKNNFPTLQILAADMDGDSVFSMPKDTKGIIVIGNEGNGVQAETLALVTQKINIPRHKNGGAESLNAAIATGIIVGALRG